jgi:hypothetical protein
MPRIFFATALHGSETCWRKFLNAAKFYECDRLICGGDMTGKAIIPLVEEDGHFSYTLAGDQQVVSAGQVGDVETQIRRKGYYPLRVSPARLAELDESLTVRADTFRRGDAGRRAALDRPGRGEARRHGGPGVLLPRKRR